jgi:phage FluMu protein Com
VTIEFRCPYCNRALRTADSSAGLRDACPDCAEMVTVPGLSREAAAQGTDAPVAGPHGGSLFEGDAWNCPMCGESIRRHHEVCPFCGERVSQLDGRYAGLAPHRAGWVLGLGVAGLATCMLGVCGILGVPVAAVAWVMANRDLAKMQQGLMDPRGEGMTKAGKIVAIVQICVAVVGILFYAALFGFGFFIRVG